MKKSRERKILGETIRRLRHENRWTQEELSEMAGLHPTYLGGIERGERNVSIDNILKIARALKVHPSSLFMEFPK